MNLLNVSIIRRLVLSRWFPSLFQIVFLMVFLFLMITGWNHFAGQGIDPKLYRKTHITTLVIWGIWWPLMVIAVVILGRVWCTICPLEWVATWSERLSRKLGFSHKSLPAWMASGFLCVVLYFCIQMAVAGLSIHRIPAYTSIFLLLLLLGAILFSLFFSDRAFCRGVCPVGVLLATYGRWGIFAVRPRSNNPDSNPGLQVDANSCPSLLNPGRLNSNRECQLCCTCIKTNSPGSMQLQIRPPFSANDVREKLTSWPVTLFVMLVSGFVLYELCSEWKSAAHVYAYVPHAIATALSLDPANGWIKGLWMLLVVPAVLWSFAALVLLGGGAATSMGEAWRRMTLPMVIVIAAGHVSKAIAKLASWGHFLPYALKDLTGHATAQAITTGTLNSPARLYSLPQAGWAGMTILVLALVFSLRETRKTGSENIWIRIIPVLWAFAFFAFLVSGWIFA